MRNISFFIFYRSGALFFVGVFLLIAYGFFLLTNMKVIEGFLLFLGNRFSNVP